MARNDGLSHPILFKGRRHFDQRETAEGTASDLWRSISDKSYNSRVFHFQILKKKIGEMPQSEHELNGQAYYDLPTAVSNLFLHRT